MPDPSKSVPLEAVEAAKRAVQETRTQPRETFYERAAHAAILAADEARGDEGGA